MKAASAPSYMQAVNDRSNESAEELCLSCGACLIPFHGIMHSGSKNIPHIHWPWHN
jgi:hypothetical protein